MSNVKYISDLGAQKVIPHLALTGQLLMFILNILGEIGVIWLDATVQINKIKKLKCRDTHMTTYQQKANYPNKQLAQRSSWGKLCWYFPEVPFTNMV